MKMGGFVLLEEKIGFERLDPFRDRSFSRAVP